MLQHNDILHGNDPIETQAQMLPGMYGLEAYEAAVKRNQYINNMLVQALFLPLRLTLSAEIQTIYEADVLLSMMGLEIAR
ncbi:MAG: hypothetical protein WCJ81_07660 [bacterium]